MAKIMSVTGVHATEIPIPIVGNMLSIAATGEVSTTGWTAIRLSPYFYIAPPADGLWDFDLIGDAPSGIVGEVVLPVGALFIGPLPSWCRGVRVHSASNALEQTLVHRKAKAIIAPSLHQARAVGRAIVQQNLGSYDDSFQPTGTIHWSSGPLGIPVPHVEMKKLHHDLVLTVEGPDEAKIRNCIQQAIAAGVIAAIVAAIGTLGAALPAAISAALGQLTGCLGDSFSVRIDDQSHWIYWDS